MTPWPYPFWIAHRGGGNVAPENTLPAFHTGLRWGWRMMECDVKLSADGVPYLMHDDTLERTTTGHGPADGLAWTELSKLDAGRWHSDWFRHTPPVPLADVATLLRRTRGAVNLEIKPMPARGRATGEAVATAAARLWAGCELPPLMSSFDLDALAACAEAAPSLPRALLVAHDTPDLWNHARQLDCVAVILAHGWIQASHVARAHAAGLQVLAYTVNDVDEAQRLIDLGLAGLISDAVDRIDPQAENTARLR